MTNILPVKLDNRLLQWVFPIVTSGAFDLFFKAVRLLWRQLRREWHEGVYEILEYDSVLELKDEKGQTAHLKRRQKVRFLQDNIIAYEDQAWGEGEIFCDYKCSPVVPVDYYQDGLKWKVLISLREAKQRGDVTVFNLERSIVSGFGDAHEWFQTELPCGTQSVH